MLAQQEPLCFLQISDKAAAVDDLIQKNYYIYLWLCYLPVYLKFTDSVILQLNLNIFYPTLTISNADIKEIKLGVYGKREGQKIPLDHNFPAISHVCLKRKKEAKCC